MKKMIKFENSPVLLRSTGSGIPPPPHLIFFINQSSLWGTHHALATLYNQNLTNAQTLLQVEPHYFNL